MVVGSDSVGIVGIGRSGSRGYTDIFVLSKSPPPPTITTTITYKQVLNVTLVVIIVMVVLLHERSFHLMVQ